MPAITFHDYVQGLQDVVGAVIESEDATLVDIQIDQRSGLRGFVAGLLQFSDGSELHFREFIDMSIPEPRLMYAYHYQDTGAALIFRYDNAAHRPSLRSADHKHTPDGLAAARPPTLADVVDECLRRGRA